MGEVIRGRFKQFKRAEPALKDSSVIVDYTLHPDQFSALSFISLFRHTTMPWQVDKWDIHRELDFATERFYDLYDLDNSEEVVGEGLEKHVKLDEEDVERKHFDYMPFRFGDHKAMMRRYHITQELLLDVITNWYLEAFEGYITNNRVEGAFFNTNDRDFVDSVQRLYQVAGGMSPRYGAPYIRSVAKVFEMARNLDNTSIKFVPSELYSADVLLYMNRRLIISAEKMSGVLSRRVDIIQ